MAVGVAIWKSGSEVHVEDALSDVGGDGNEVTPFELFHEHARAVEETVEYMLEAVNVACDGEDATKAIEMTIKTERKADHVKASVRLAMNDRRLRMSQLMTSFTVSRQAALPTMLRTSQSS